MATQQRVPTGDDSVSSTFTLYPTSPTTRYDKVDDAIGSPDDDSTYIEGTNNAGGYACFTFAAFTIPAGSTIQSVAVTYRAKETGVGASSSYGCIKTGTTQRTSSGADPGGSYSDRTVTWTTNPATSAAWQVDEVNGTDSETTHRLTAFGIGGTDWAPDTRFTQVYCTVTYTEPSASASGSLKPQLPLLGGTATNVPPARSASGSLKPQLPLLGGTATNVPPARSASGGLALQLPLLGGTATNAAAAARSAAGGLRAQLPLFGGTGTNTPPARSASGSLAVQLPLFSGTATNVPPPRSAAGSLALQLPLLGGTATNGPPSREAAGGLAAQLPALGGSATNVPPARSGAGGLAAQLPLFSGEATNVPPARTASGGLRLQLPSLGGSATSAAVRSAAGGLALSLPSLGGSATNTPPPRSASGGLALSLPALGGTATNTPPPRTAAGGLRVPLPSLGGAATVAEAEPRTAAGGLALSAPSLSGTAAQTYPALFFDGIDDTVPLGDLGLCEDGAFTFETICRPYDAEGTRYVLGESGAVARVGLGVADGAAYARLVSDTGVVVTLTGADVTDDELRYMALAAYGGTAYLYVDGALADSEALPAGGFTMTATTLGALAGADFWYGEVAVARTYPMGLDATAIAAQYDAWLEWLVHVADADLVATLAPAGFRARLVPIAFEAEQTAGGFRARTAPTGFEAEITTPGFSTTTRS